jgi:hypothetical protein
MSIELDPTVTSNLFESAESIIEDARDGLIKGDDISQLFECIAKQLESLFELRNGRGNEEDADEEDLEQQKKNQEEEDTLLEQART